MIRLDGVKVGSARVRFPSRVIDKRLVESALDGRLSQHEYVFPVLRQDFLEDVLGAPEQRMVLMVVGVLQCALD